MLCYTTQRQLPCTYLTPRCSLYFEMLTTEERKVSHKRPCLFSRYQNICGMVKLTDNNKVAIRRASAGHALQSQSRIVHKLTPSGKTPQFCKKDQTQRNPGSQVSIFHDPRVRISLFRQKNNIKGGCICGSTQKPHDSCRRFQAGTLDSCRLFHGGRPFSLPCSNSSSRVRP
jgi:hypothetical protein